MLNPRYPGEEVCGRVAVSSQRFVQLVQFLQDAPLVLVLPQGPVPDQPAVVVQGAAEPTGAEPADAAVLLHLAGRRRVTSRVRQGHTKLQKTKLTGLSK